MRILCFGLILWTVVSIVAHAAHKSSESHITLEQIETERQRIETAQITDEEKRQQALSMLEEARVWLQEADKWRQEKNHLEELLTSKKRPVRESLPHLSPFKLKRWKKERLEKELAVRKTRLQEVRDEFDRQEKLLTELITAAKTGGGEIAKARQRLEETRKALASIQSDDPLLGHEQRLRLQAREHLLEEQLDFLTLRQNNIEPLVAEVQKRRDQLAQQLESLHADIKHIQDLIQVKQDVGVHKEETGVEKYLPPVLRPLQNEIDQLAEEHEEVLNLSLETDRSLSAAKRQLNDLKSDFNHVRHIVKAVGNEEAVASLLLGRLADLPSIQDLHTQIVVVEKRLNQAEIRQLYVEEWLRENRDFTSWSQTFLEEVEEGEKDSLRKNMRLFWEDLRASKQALLQTYTSYISKLSELEATLRRLQDVVGDYRSFLEKQLIWIPTTTPIALKTPGLLIEAVQWLISPQMWINGFDDCRKVVRYRPGTFAVWVLALGVLVGLRRRCRIWLKEAAEATRRVRTDSFAATVLALFSTVILASPLAVFLLGAGWMLVSHKGLQEDTIAIGQGLISTGQLEWLLSWLVQMTRKDGLAYLHLRWSEPLCRQVHSQAKWIRPLAVPLAFLVQVSAERMEESMLLALGRWSFNLLMVVLIVVIYRIWRRKGPLMRSLANLPYESAWIRFHYLWFPLLLAVPMGLIMATLLGYFYMALLLINYLFDTLIFIIALLLVRDLLMRWLSVVKRRVRFEEIVRRHQEAATGEDKSSEELPSLHEADELDYSQLSDQVRQLVQTGFLVSIFFGLWFIWKDLIPAFNIFGNIQLPLTTTRMEEGIIREVPLTLGDVLTGLLLAGLTLLAARKLPALLELTVLQYLPLTHPSRYAISTLTQYLVVMIGIILTFKALGLRWSSIQWLVAALSVGLGFGLQEVVANFVSGVILLFEQPIRVGDVVTVDNVTGTVAKIRIRATTIVNWDRQELVIPNKNFITGQLINWTLSDTITRIIITVGIAYGSDVEKAMELMKEAAQENPKVLKEPAPLVTFEEFGDNALTMLLRAYLGSVDIRLSTTTELHKAINEKFARAGIVIAYPQRDIHLDNARPLEIVLRQDPDHH